jgi:hypothetical protein
VTVNGQICDAGRHMADAVVLSPTTTGRDSCTTFLVVFGARYEKPRVGPAAIKRHELIDDACACVHRAMWRVVHSLARSRHPERSR